ncbi:MarR family transcriptional regulator [Pendulispora brunnea]|uniref:MarR family transcriptional regulator n=1 Tax=Pendulispora brunnea TaxID=2905690 RepID=A0ABZ2KG45_9BACT
MKRSQAAAASASTTDARKDIDELLKTLIYLYTENRRVVKALAARASLTGPQLTVVKMLEHMGDLSLSELSDAIRAQNSTVTGIVDRMEREGIVERVRSTDDRRVVRIHLTEKGNKLASEIPIEPIGIFESALEALSPQELRDALRVAAKVTARIKAIIKRDFPDLGDPKE